MSTSLLNCEILLSKQLGDYWSGTTTSLGTSTTVVDTALKAKADDWITDEAYDMITSGTYDEEERKISNLANSSGILTVLAHGGAIASGVTYRVHRLFEASEKARALIHGAKAGFPHIFKQVRDESKTVGNWLKDGSFEIWATSADPTYWSNSTTVTTKTIASPYYKHGKTSAKLTTAGYIYQSIVELDDLKRLAGKDVTFTIQGWCDTASTLRLAIYDGTSTTYSSYHTGDSAWTEDDDPLSVEATIQDKPTAIEFRIYLDTANIAYVDDAQVNGPTRDRLYIGDLGLAQDRPHQIFQTADVYINQEPWKLLRNYTIGSDNYLYLPESTNEYRLRIVGIGYLDFLLAGVSSTDWSATIAIDSPQTEILVAEAAVYLCNQMAMPNYVSGTIDKWMKALAYWKVELQDRRAKFGMKTPPATTHWG